MFQEVFTLLNLLIAFIEQSSQVLPNPFTNITNTYNNINYTALTIGNKKNKQQGGENSPSSTIVNQKTSKLSSRIHRIESYGALSEASFSSTLNCEQLLSKINKKHKTNTVSPIALPAQGCFSPQKGYMHACTLGGPNNRNRQINRVGSMSANQTLCSGNGGVNFGLSGIGGLMSMNPLKIEDLSFNGLSSEDKETIEMVIKKHIFFKTIPREAFEILVSEFFSFSYENNKTIYEQGEEGNFFYIIGSGCVKGISTHETNTNTNITTTNDNDDNNNNLPQYETKERIYDTLTCFGEQALLSTFSREETIITQSKVLLYALDGETYRKIRSSFNEASLKDKYAFLNTIPTFQCLDSISKYNVANHLRKKKFGINETIIKYGEMGETLYIIKKGVVSCRIGSNEIRKMAKHEFFGQNAVLIDMKRACDVVSIKNTTCYELSRNDLKEALGMNYVNIILFAYFQNCIMNNPFLKDLFIDFKQFELFQCFNINHYGFKEKIVSPHNENQSTRRIACIIDGGIFRENQKSKLLEPYANKGEIIGEQLLKDASLELPLDIIAYPDCISLEANICDVCKILNLNMNTVLIDKDDINHITHTETFNHYDKISSLKKVHLFHNLSDNTLLTISKIMVKRKYKYEDVIVNEGDNGDSLFLITKGRVRIIMNGNIIRDLESGNCFGEIAMLKNGIKRTATVIAIEKKVVCYEISKKDFDKHIIDDDIKTYMKKKISLQDTSIKLNELYYIKFLGKGKFGSVSLVHNKVNFYAIKQVSRKAVLNEKVLAQYFVNERNIMLSLDHPFIVKLVKTLKNDLYCFYLMEFIKGKNFGSYLAHSATPKLHIENTRFYIGSILIIIDYLQKKYIAHRDIKPANIMIDSNGYLKMIDFGTAKVLYDYTNTTIGTPHYIAPEVLKGKCYSLSCDFWSIGICMYEIFYGYYPFGRGAKDVMDVYQEIIYKDVRFPGIKDSFEHVNDFISELLVKKVNKRTCKVRLLKERPFFDGFEWDDLIEFKMKAPFIPPVDKGEDELLKKINKPFESMVKEDKTVVKPNKKENKDFKWLEKWANEF